MKRKLSNSTSSGIFEITDDLKSEVSRRLGTIPTDTLLGIAYRRFSSNGTQRSNGDFQELLYNIYSEIQQNPKVIKQVLGNNYDYFASFFSTTGLRADRRMNK